MQYGGKEVRRYTVPRTSGSQQGSSTLIVFQLFDGLGYFRKLLCVVKVVDRWKVRECVKDVGVHWVGVVEKASKML